jgi:outer membrane immunogenic protein
MRFVVLVLAAFLSATGAHAQAQDSSPPYLRGSQSYVPSYPVYFRWAGLYFGGTASYTAGEVDVGNGAQSLIQFLLRNTLLEQQACVSCWVTMTPRTASTGGYGGFMGYNSQWDELILGLEVSYSRVNVDVTNTGGLSRIVTLSDQFQYNVTVDSTMRVQLTDMATFRARAGYVMGPFLPYIAAVAAAGRGSYLKAASVSYPTPVDVSGAGRFLPAAAVSGSESKNDALFYGYGVALGVDIALLQNVFVRGEYEFVTMHAYDIKFNLSTVRAGVGLKF